MSLRKQKGGKLTPMGSKRRRRVRARLWKEQGGLCALCGDSMAMDASKPNGATIDHIIPTSKGGSNALENLQLAHRQCNCDRGHRPVQSPPPAKKRP